MPVACEAGSAAGDEADEGYDDDYAAKDKEELAATTFAISAFDVNFTATDGISPIPRFNCLL